MSLTRDHLMLSLKDTAGPRSIVGTSSNKTISSSLSSKNNTAINISRTSLTINLTTPLIQVVDITIRTTNRSRATATNLTSLTNRNNKAITKVIRK